ncbi:MAG TPA: adenylyl-sulfate kinase [Acidimicrobiales bacterium]|nr:adenylyl-sulfate kinase [Acidimicrobiales bacterium]
MTRPHSLAVPPAGDLTWHAGEVDRVRRWAALGPGAAGATIWLTGLSGSGKSTVAMVVERLLIEGGRAAYVLDGDNVRHGLNADLGFGDADRVENVRRLGEVAKLLADAGLVALVPAISPFRAGREAVRASHQYAGLAFVEVHLDTPLAECERRDPKGLYARARTGELGAMTGIDSPYEAPEHPELVLTPADGDAEAQAALVLAALTGRS